MKLSLLAQRIEAGLLGDPEGEVGRVAPLKAAGPGDLTFLTRGAYRPLAQSCQATALLVGEKEGAPLVPYRQGGPSLLHCPNPYLALARALEILGDPARDLGQGWPRGISPSAWVHPEATVHPTASVGPMAIIEAGAQVGPEAIIGPGAYVGREARVGPGSILHPQAVLMDRCVTGTQVILHPCAVVGSDGFAFATNGRRLVRLAHQGAVVLEDHVEVGAGCTVDRGLLEDTRIARGTRLDDQVHVAHNVTIGPDCALAAQVGLSGSVTLGAGVRVGGQAGLVGHLEVGQDASIGAKSGVAHHVPDNATVSGYPALPHEEWLRLCAEVRRLPELRRRLARLEATMGQGSGGSSDDPTSQVMASLPHRPPMLMIDRVEALDRDRVVGVKRVRASELFVQGHFPGRPLLPGALVLEAMAQVGQVLVHSLEPLDPEREVLLFRGADRFRLRRAVVPGDLLRLELSLLWRRESLWCMRGKASVGDHGVATAELLAARSTWERVLSGR